MRYTIELTRQRNRILEVQNLEQHAVQRLVERIEGLVQFVDQAVMELANALHLLVLILLTAWKVPFPSTKSKVP